MPNLSYLTFCVLLTTAQSGSAAERPSPPAMLNADPSDCSRNVVVTGYWPATNEMLRPWSTNAAQNPTGWVGENWRGKGFDVYAFFPEFPPDGDPMNDPFGSDGWVGAPDADLRVDFQDTSSDFWRIVDVYQPHVMITTSRGGSIGWEVEAFEGGHDGGSANPAEDWRSDQHGATTLPTQRSIEPRSWDAIATYRRGKRLNSQLPMDAVVAAATALDLTSVQIDDGTSGNYLSGFAALHGLYYNQLNPHNVAAGHIHVGVDVSTADARQLMEATLDAVLGQFNAAALPCP